MDPSMYMRQLEAVVVSMYYRVLLRMKFVLDPMESTVRNGFVDDFAQ
jgi:hypothetical protein